MGSVESVILEKPAQQSKLLPIAMLAVCCLLWGFSFPIAQRCAAIMERAGGSDQLGTAVRSAFNALRFGVAALVYLLLTLPQQRHFSRADLLGGTSVGVFFTLGVFLQLVGLRYTTPSVSAFLTALAVVFAPLAQAGILKRKVSGTMWLSVILATGGTALLSWPGADSMGANSFVEKPPIPLLGEMLTVIASGMFTLQILALDRYGQSANPVRLTSVMFGVCAILSALISCAWGGASLFSPAVLQTLASDVSFAWMFIALVLLCSLAAMHLMNKYQPLIAPAAATVIYCLEPVFATAYSGLMGAESITALTLAGGGIILIAVLLIAKA